MKKFMSFWAIALLALCIAACGDDTNNAPVDNNTVTDDTVTDDTTADDQSDPTDQTDQSVTDETVTDETVTDTTVTDDIVTDNEEVDNELPDEDTAIGYNFGGKWAMLNFTTSNVTTTIPVIGQQNSVSTTSAYFLVEMTDNGDGTVSAVGTACDTLIDSGSNLLTVTISDNYIAHLKPMIWDFATILNRNGIGYQVTATDILTLNGVQNLTNPMTDPLPTDKNDAAVYDQDMDGHPGMTVDCNGNIPLVFSGPGTMYTVQRTINDLAGGTVDDNNIAGALVWESQQNVLEASNSALTSEKTVEPDLANSWFKLVRLVDQNWTCAEIKANEGVLFPQ